MGEGYIGWERGIEGISGIRVGEGYMCMRYCTVYLPCIQCRRLRVDVPAGVCEKYT